MSGGCADLDKPISTADLCCRGFGGTYFTIDESNVIGRVEVSTPTSKEPVTG